MEPINVFDYEARAQDCMKQEVWEYYQCGSDDEVTLRANRAAFERLRLRPRVLIGIESYHLETTVLGTPISMPIMVAPTAFHSLAHPDGECATAAGTGRAGTLMVASTSSTRTLEDIAGTAVGPLWFQLYVSGRTSAAKLIRRAATAGYRAIVLTVDSPRWGNKERAWRSGFRVPQKANMDEDETAGGTLSLTWDSLAWLRSLSPLPLVLKGILTAEDALLAVEHGAGGIIVSNHGGRQLDGAIASIEALPEVVEAAGGRCEVYLDGGIRRGTDVLKALALGARAVLVGRPALWGLAVDGANGVYHVLDILRNELELALALAGQPSVEHIDRALVR